MAITDSAPDFRIGRVVSLTFGVLKRNLITFLVAALILLSPVVIVSIYNGTNNYVLSFNRHGVLLGIVSAVLPLLCYYLLQASLVRATITDLNGDPSSLGESLSAGWRLAVPVIGVMILKYIVMIFGFALLIVPGIIVALAWSVAVPALVAEHIGIGNSLSRSQVLTKGHRWQILALMAMYFLLIVVLFGLTAVIARVNLLNPAAQAAPGQFYLVASWVMQVITSTITAAGATVMYFELRAAKEGLAPEQLVKAFD